MEREASVREGQLQSRTEEVASLQESARGAQAQVNQYLLDLQVSWGGGEGVSA